MFPKLLRTRSVQQLGISLRDEQTPLLEPVDHIELVYLVHLDYRKFCTSRHCLASSRKPGDKSLIKARLYPKYLYTGTHDSSISNPVPGNQGNKVIASRPETGKGKKV
jgi:hypothetical protein